MTNDIIDDYLDGKSEISSLYAESRKREIDTSKSDAIVLAAARRDLESRPESVRSTATKLYKWIVPMSVAATVVLTATLFVSNQGVLDAPSYSPPDLIKSKNERIDQEAALPVLEKASPMVKDALRTEVESDKEDVEQFQAKGLRQQADSPAMSMTVDDAVSEMPSSVFADKDLMGMVSADVEEESEIRGVEGWITDIKQLISTGQLETARLEIAALLKAYPDVVIPAEMSELVGHARNWSGVEGAE